MWISKENKIPWQIDLFIAATALLLGLLVTRLQDWWHLLPVVVLLIGISTVPAKLENSKFFLSYALKDFRVLIPSVSITAVLVYNYHTIQVGEPLKTYFFGVTLLWFYSSIYREILENSGVIKDVSFNAYFTQVKTFIWLRIFFFLSLFMLVPTLTAGFKLFEFSWFLKSFVIYTLLFSVLRFWIRPGIFYLRNNLDALKYLELIYTLHRRSLSFSEIRNILKIEDERLRLFLETATKKNKLVKVGRNYELTTHVGPTRFLFGL